MFHIIQKIIFYVSLGYFYKPLRFLFSVVRIIHKRSQLRKKKGKHSSEYNQFVTIFHRQNMLNINHECYRFDKINDTDSRCFVPANPSLDYFIVNVSYCVNCKCQRKPITSSTSAHRICTVIPIKQSRVY